MDTEGICRYPLCPNRKDRLFGIAQHHIMCSAFHNTGGRNQRDLGFLLQLRDRQRAAVAHGGAHLAQG